MRRILDIGHTDLRLFMKKKSAYVWLFVVPLIFVYFFGSLNKTAGDPSNRRPRMWIENADTGFLGTLFIDELTTQGVRRMKEEDRKDAVATIRIPADFTGKVLKHEPTKVQFLPGEKLEEADESIIQARLFRTLIAMNGHLLEAATQTNAPATLTETQFREIIARPDTVALDARFAGRKPVPSGFNFSLPGNLVMYLMMNILIFGGATIAVERRSGIIKRLMVHPITRGELVTGKIYGLMLLGAVQIFFFLVMGKFVFHVPLGANLPAVTLTLLMFAWVAGSLGVLAGSVIAAEDRVTGVCVLASLIMAAVGGCWWPLEISPPSLQSAALWLPTGWAMRALHQLISFGSGMEAVVKPLLVLFAMGLGANLLAARFFRS